MLFTNNDEYDHCLIVSILSILLHLSFLHTPIANKIKNDACGWPSIPNDIINPATRATPPDRRAIPDSEICCPRDGLGNRPVSSPARHGLQVTFRSDIIFLPSFLLSSSLLGHLTYDHCRLVCRFNNRPGLEAHTAGRFYINPIPTCPTLVRFGQ